MVPLGYEVTREVMVESVDVPPTAEAESVIPVRIVLRAAGPAEGVLRLVRDGVELDINGDGPGAGRPLRLTPGRQVEVADIQLEPGRVHRFDAVWEPRAERSGETTRFAGDTRTENNTASGLTITPGQGEVLIVDGVNQASPNGGAAMLSRTLGAAGLRVSMVAPSAFPEDLVSLQAYDLIVLQDVPADELSQRAQQSLAAHVQELGAGLVMLGGHSSFAPGGWRGSPIEPLLPVDMEIPDEMVIPTAAVMIVLDASGSMGHSVMGSLANKQEIANESAALAVATLDKRDLVGVIAFANFSREVAPLAPNTDPGATAERIRGISPGGGTVIGPALERASQALVAIDAEIKHVILLSDGQSVDAESLPAMAEQLGLLGIRVTTISVGSSADGATMEQIAQRSGGKHYAVLNPNVLPRVFIKAIRIVRTPMVREGAFVPRILSTGSTLIEPLAETPGMPALGGLVLTQARKDPSITTAMVTGKGEPVLAHWQVGLGQVAAFTSDARSDAWASAWARWPGYAEFWTRLARALSRPTDAGPYELRLAPEGDDLILRLEAADEQGRPIDYLSAPASVYTEDGGVREVRLTQIAPGLYEARVRGVEPGQVVAVVKPRLGEEALPPAVGGTTIASGAEFRALRSNQGLLGRLADETGGVLNLARPDLAGLFDRVGPGARHRRAHLPAAHAAHARAVRAGCRDPARGVGPVRQPRVRGGSPQGRGRGGTPARGAGRAHARRASGQGRAGPLRGAGGVVAGRAPAGPLDDDAARAASSSRPGPGASGMRPSVFARSAMRCWGRQGPRRRPNRRGPARNHPRRTPAPAVCSPPNAALASDSSRDRTAREDPAPPAAADHAVQRPRRRLCQVPPDLPGRGDRRGGGGPWRARGSCRGRHRRGHGHLRASARRPRSAGVRRRAQRRDARHGPRRDGGRRSRTVPLRRGRRRCVGGRHGRIHHAA